MPGSDVIIGARNLRQVSLDFVCSDRRVFRIPPTSSCRSSFVLLSISLSVHPDDRSCLGASHPGKHRLRGGFAAVFALADVNRFYTAAG